MASMTGVLFTQDQYLTVPFTCERTACSYVIPPGQPRNLISNDGVPNATSTSIWVCLTCVAYYSDKKKKLLEAAAGGAGLLTQSREVQQHSNRTFDEGTIRQKVNAAQKKGATREERQVSSFAGQASQRRGNLDRPERSQNTRAMGPPSFIPPSKPRSTSSSQQNISLPRAHWNQYSTSIQENTTPAPLGYSRDHASHSSEVTRWRSKSYVETNEIVNVVFSVVVEAAASGKGRSSAKPVFTLVPTLTEGAQVDGFITAGQLVDKAVELLWPRLHQALPGFSFNLDVMVVREILTWIDLAHYAKKNTNKPFLYERCLALPRINSKPGTEKKFKTNVKPFEFALVIPPAHYQAYEETVKRKKREERKRNGRNGRNHHHSEDEDEEDLQEELDEVEEEEEPEIEYSTQWAEDIYDDVPAAAPANSQSLFTDKAAAQETPSLPLFLSVEDDDDELPEAPSTGLFIGSKRRERSDSLQTPSTPPQSKKRVVYVSPDRQKTKAALKTGGVMVPKDLGAFEGVSQYIEFCPIPHLPFDELIALDDPKFQFNAITARQGRIFVRPEIFGKGGFKTAHLARIALTPTSHSGLGTTPNESIIAKRPYYDTQKKPRTRFPPKKELELIIKEASVFLWADSLLVLGYSWIQHALSLTDEEPPFDIPQLTFVNAGIAVVHSDVRGTTVKSATTVEITFLLEEIIVGDQEKFTKYVHNGSAHHDLQTGDPNLEIASFLCFMQHLQFWKTGGLAYTSDFQGMNNMLTDPQIMTSPTLYGEGSNHDVFGEGNVRAAFEKFPEEHECNVFCDWFDLPPAPCCVEGCDKEDTDSEESDKEDKGPDEQDELDSDG